MPVITEVLIRYLMWTVPLPNSAVLLQGEETLVKISFSGIFYYLITRSESLKEIPMRPDKIPHLLPLLLLCSAIFNIISAEQR